MVFGKSASPTGPVDGWMQSGPSPITLQERFFPHPVRVARHFATACQPRVLEKRRCCRVAPVTPLLLSLHVLAAIIGFGPAFVFPFLGVMSAREPAHAHVLQRLGELISTRLIIPVALTMAVTGALLIGEMHVDLAKNSWLGASIIPYILVMAALILQAPTQRKLIALIDPARGGPPPADEMKPLVSRLRLIGILLAVAIVVIAVLMV